MALEQIPFNTSKDKQSEDESSETLPMHLRRPPHEGAMFEVRVNDIRPPILRGVEWPPAETPQTTVEAPVERPVPMPEVTVDLRQLPAPPEPQPRQEAAPYVSAAEDVPWEPLAPVAIQASVSLPPAERAGDSQPQPTRPEQSGYKLVAPVAVESLGQPTSVPEQSPEWSPEASATPRGIHVEHSWYDAVVDRNGKVVDGGLPKGRALYEEQQPERAGYHYPQYTPGSAAAQDDAVSYAQQDAQQAAIPQPTLPSGRIGSGQQLPSGPVVDAQHLLLDAKNPLARTLGSPWLWVGLAILLLAFFSAAFL